MKRFMKQKIGIEKAHYQPTFSIFFKMFRWNKRFEQKGKPKFFKQQSDLLNKILVVQHKRIWITSFNNSKAYPDKRIRFFKHFSLCV